LEHRFRLCGPAFTVRYLPVDQSGGGSVGDFLDDVPHGAVVVIDNGGRNDATVWGDLMTTVAARNGLAGTVIDGVSRDTDRALELGYPIFARTTFMRTGKDRVALVDVNAPVKLGHHRVHAEDVVVGDADGVVVIPRARVAEVITVAAEIHNAEERIRALLRDGTRLDEARRQAGYHQLQRRQT
jgi:regulator of RNase E activity RraA